MLYHLTWNTRRRPHQDSHLGQKAILSKTRTKFSAPSCARFWVRTEPSAPSSTSRHRVCASTVRPALLARSVHLDSPRSPSFSNGLLVASHGAHIAVLVPRAGRHLPQDSNKMLGAILNNTPGSDRTLGAIIRERALKENKKTALIFIVHRRRDPSIHPANGDSPAARDSH